MVILSIEGICDGFYVIKNAYYFGTEAYHFGKFLGIFVDCFNGLV